MRPFGQYSRASRDGRAPCGRDVGFPLTLALSPDPLRRRDLPRLCASTAGSAAREREKHRLSYGKSAQDLGTKSARRRRQKGF